MTDYRIRDASGTLVAVHCRLDGPGGKRMWWEQPDGTSGLGGLSTADLPLYGVDRLTATTVVILVEGEKAADALLAIGVQAVGTVTGASATPGPTALVELTRRRVYLWADNDKVGRSHMERIGAALTVIAAETRWIEWIAAPEHGDAADFVAAGGTRQDVDALVNGARPLLPAVGLESEPHSSEPWEPCAASRTGSASATRPGWVPGSARSAPPSTCTSGTPTRWSPSSTTSPTGA
jgi:hypothetical protein